MAIILLTLQGVKGFIVGHEESFSNESGDARYRWQEPWGNSKKACPPESWAHGDLVVTADGSVVTFDALTAALLTFSPDGQLLETSTTNLHAPHGLSIVPTKADRLWVADIGMAATLDANSPNGWGACLTQGRVVQVALNGETIQELPSPSGKAYDTTAYIPTDVIGSPSGDTWVADGYGASLVHRFNSLGEHVATVDGNDLGIGRFSCPHGLLIDDRGSEPQLMIADRGNKRLVILDMDGGLIRETGFGLTSPSAMAIYGDLLVVAELHASVALLDRGGKLIGRLGDAADVCDRPGWPNRENDEGVLVAPELAADRFNSPHGIAVDVDGNLYVTEWLIGGRVVQLAADR